jgi:hypothetical protein
MVIPTYPVGNPINLPMVENDEERIKLKYCMELGFVH